jgi:hypothetical protein
MATGETGFDDVTFAGMSSKRVLELRLGSVTVDLPRTLGYYGGVAAAVGLGLAEPPLAVFIAAVPLMKLLTHRALPVPVRAVGEFLEGVSKPVGGDDDAVFGLEDHRREAEEARELASKAARGQRHTDPTGHVTV